MRFKNRLLGGLLALFGAVILVESGYGLFNKNWEFETTVLFADFFSLAVGIGFILVGRYYWRIDVDAPVEAQPTSDFTRFLVNHRHQLKVLSQTGVALSLIAFIAACFGHELTKRAWLPLMIGALVLNSFATKVANPEIADNRDWMRVPGWIRQALPRIEKPLGVAWFLVIGLVLVNEWLFHSALSDRSAYRVAVLLVVYAMPASMYALQALFFKYGELRAAGAPSAT